MFEQRQTFEPRRSYERRQRAVRRDIESRDTQEDFSKAPPPRKPGTDASKTVVVLGDSMADWLAYGLEDAFADSADELGVVRKARTGSGLIRNEPQDYDWLQAAQELGNQKTDVVIIMLGLADRHAIRERPPKAASSDAQKSSGSPPRPGETPPASDTTKPAEADLAGQAPESSSDSAARAGDSSRPESERAGPAISRDFGTQKWAELYAARIDQMITALKKKGVPVLWVGLPPIRGSKASTEITFLNNQFKARAEKAGIVYVDVWDGLSDDDGVYASYGPDVAGQVRRLRTADGVHFTKAGARKLAYYVEREIHRLTSRTMAVGVPVAKEPEKATGSGQPKAPAARPVAGPVVPLTTQQQRGESGARLDGGTDIQLDPLAAKVLLKGESVQGAKGRADDFSWPAVTAETTDAIAPPEPPAANRQAPPVKRAARSKAEAKKAERGQSSPSRQTTGQSSSSRSR